MTLQKIKKQLVELQPELTGANGFVSSETVNKLLAMLESCYSAAAESAETIQLLKDEINRLKGEDGKVEIKASTGSSYSTEKERKAAESSLEPTEIGFRLTKDKLNALSETQIPKDVLDTLAVIKNKKFSSEDGFMEEVVKVLGKDQADTYRELLLKHGHYKKRNRKSKVAGIEIDRIEKCKIDPSVLPIDAYYVGDEDNIVQDIIIKRDNIMFKKEVYYSPSRHKTFMAEVPVGYEGCYGPGIKTEIPVMKYINNMSEPRIHAALQSLGAIISPTYISNRLTFPIYMQPFIDEKNDLFKAALEVSSFLQIDDTGCRVNGTNQYVQILCNNLFTAFFTVPHKDRLTVLDILRNFESRRFIFNDDTFHFLEMFNVGKKIISKIRALTDTEEYDEKRLNDFLTELFPDFRKGKNTRKRIAEAAAIAHYHQSNEFGIVNILVADDAPQFKLLSLFLALCWVHMGRHLKKLNPVVPKFKNELEDFQNKFWIYYGKLREFQKNPHEVRIKELEDEFDKLFSIQTGYPELNERIEKIGNKKENLLTVLKYPDVPLNNNGSENGARIQKRREDVSLQTKSRDGTIAKDAMMSIVETCRKLGINSRDFIRDRILQLREIPKLADIIRTHSST
jgi:hypothetical protein